MFLRNVSIQRELVDAENFIHCVQTSKLFIEVLQSAYLFSLLFECQSQINNT